ncbi:MAG: nucleotidyltransferase [Pirellulales bacterium]|nr:nucleotidyltransferase [Pirellulales bacterium]
MAVKAKRDFVTLSLAPSETETQKAVRTHNMIREHLEGDPALGKYNIRTYLQGSYKNSTNVRGDSDVDMGSQSQESFFYDLDDLPDDSIPSYSNMAKSLRKKVQESIVDSRFTYWDYRRDVYASLKLEYGVVEDGNKAIRIDGNTYRLDADVLPCLGFRMYFKDLTGNADYHQGIGFLTSQSKRIVNFPDQHFDNLGAKDRRNNNKVKGCVRIMKRLRNELEDAGRWDRKRSPSFYLESLVWNVPDHVFSGGYSSVLQNVLAHLWNDLREKKQQNDLRAYTQANNIFYLFHPEFWNVDDALAFIDEIWKAAFDE